jgi:hypothetical protein
MIQMRRRETPVMVSGGVSSLVLSLLASAAATYLARRFLSTETAAGGTDPEAGEGQAPRGNVQVQVPVIVLTVTVMSGNRLGIGRRGMPPPFFLPFLLARLLRKKRQQQRARWQSRRH